ncbi:hypothetical protein R1sor_012211 [Riccia sorocarpa]|uniref:Uncharacterized protein n=1 Tax=Riccia sorocarpa TaxID=122646 RepID=A0ABD3I6Y2_9MARC
MAGRRARCVSAQLLVYLQAWFGTGGQKKTTKYNIASFIAVITEAECETWFEIPETGWDFSADGLEDDEDEERDIPGAGKP